MFHLSAFSTEDAWHCSLDVMTRDHSAPAYRKRTFVGTP